MAETAATSIPAWQTDDLADEWIEDDEEEQDITDAINDGGRTRTRRNEEDRDEDTSTRTREMKGTFNARGSCQFGSVTSTMTNPVVGGSGGSVQENEDGSTTTTQAGGTFVVRDELPPPVLPQTPALKRAVGGMKNLFSPSQLERMFEPPSPPKATSSTATATSTTPPPPISVQQSSNGVESRNAHVAAEPEVEKEQTATRPQTVMVLPPMHPTPTPFPRRISSRPANPSKLSQVIKVASPTTTEEETETEHEGNMKKNGGKGEESSRSSTPVQVKVEEEDEAHVFEGKLDRFGDNGTTSEKEFTFNIPMCIARTPTNLPNRVEQQTRATVERRDTNNNGLQKGAPNVPVPIPPFLTTPNANANIQKKFTSPLPIHTDPRLRLFQFNYDTYTKEHLSAIADSFVINSPSNNSSSRTSASTMLAFSPESKDGGDKESSEDFDIVKFSQQHQLELRDEDEQNQQQQQQQRASKRLKLTPSPDFPSLTNFSPPGNPMLNPMFIAPLQFRPAQGRRDYVGESRSLMERIRQARDVSLLSVGNVTEMEQQIPPTPAPTQPDPDERISTTANKGSPTKPAVMDARQSTMAYRKSAADLMAKIKESRRKVSDRSDSSFTSSKSEGEGGFERSMAPSPPSHQQQQQQTAGAKRPQSPVKRRLVDKDMDSDPDPDPDPPSYAASVGPSFGAAAAGDAMRENEGTNGVAATTAPLRTNNNRRARNNGQRRGSANAHRNGSSRPPMVVPVVIPEEISPTTATGTTDRIRSPNPAFLAPPTTSLRNPIQMRSESTNEDLNRLVSVGSTLTNGTSITIGSAGSGVKHAGPAQMVRIVPGDLPTLPERVGGMVFDRALGRWIKERGTSQRSVVRPSASREKPSTSVQGSPANTEGTEESDDPFRDFESLREGTEEGEGESQSRSLAGLRAQDVTGYTIGDLDPGVEGREDGECRGEQEGEGNLSNGSGAGSEDMQVVDSSYGSLLDFTNAAEKSFNNGEMSFGERERDKSAMSSFSFDQPSAATVEALTRDAEMRSQILGDETTDSDEELAQQQLQQREQILQHQQRKRQRGQEHQRHPQNRMKPDDEDEEFMENFASLSLDRNPLVPIGDPSMSISMDASGLWPVEEDPERDEIEGAGAQGQMQGIDENLDEDEGPSSISVASPVPATTIVTTNAVASTPRPAHPPLSQTSSQIQPPRSALKSASVTPASRAGGQGRSVSFSDGRKDGKIKGLQDSESEESTVTGSLGSASAAAGAAAMMRNGKNGGVGEEDGKGPIVLSSAKSIQSLPSVRSKRIAELLGDLEESMLEEDDSPSRQASERAQQHQLQQQHATEHNQPDPATSTVSQRPFTRSQTIRPPGQSSPRRINTPTRANGTFLTECSFGVAHDRLVQVITDVQPFEPCWEALESMSLAGKRLDSVARLKEFLPKLETLNLNDNLLSWLSGIPSTVRTLTVASNALTSMTSFAHLKHIEVLDISRNDINSLQNLECLKHLRELRADDNKITQLDGILHLDGLVKLSVEGNELGNVDISGSRWHRLELLNLSNNCIETITGLRALVSLVSLNLDNNLLSTLDEPLPLPSHHHHPHPEVNTRTRGSSKEPTTNTNAITHTNTNTNANANGTYPVVSTLLKLRMLRLSGNKLKRLDAARFPNLRTLYVDNDCLAVATTECGSGSSASEKGMAKQGQGQGQKKLMNLSRLSKLENFSARNQVGGGYRESSLMLEGKDIRDIKRLYLSGNPNPLPFPSPSSSPSPSPTLTITNACYNLLYLELAACRLTTLPPTFSSLFPNLRALNLNYNFLDVEGLVEGCKGLGRLRKLSVVGNRLEGTKGVIRMLGGMGGVLEVVDFRMNPCTLGWYLPLLVQGKDDGALLQPSESSRSSRASSNGRNSDKEGKRSINSSSTGSSGVTKVGSGGGGYGGSGSGEEGEEEMDNLGYPTAPNPTSTSTSSSKPPPSHWETLDSAYRRGLPDKQYAGRLAYRGLVMSACPLLRVLDDVRVGEKERRKAEGLLRRVLEIRGGGG